MLGRGGEGTEDVQSLSVSHLGFDWSVKMLLVIHAHTNLLVKFTFSLSIPLCFTAIAP